MSQKEKRISDSKFSRWVGDSLALDDDFEVARLSAARARALQEAGAATARQLNGPLTALLLYVGELRQHSHRLSLAAGNKIHLQQVVENAVQETERVRAMIKRMAGNPETVGAAPVPNTGLERPGPVRDGSCAPGAMFSTGSGHKPLTRREREVLNLIGKGHSNKRGALLLRISPRTFESHRAEAMRKLGARNAAELVRSALLHSGAV